MKRAERDAAVDKVALMLVPLWNEHRDACTDDTCPAAAKVDEAFRALYSLRKT